MKRLIVIVAVLLSLAISLSACQPTPEGDENITVVNNQAPTEPGPSGVNVFLKTQIAAGQYGIIQINRIIDGVEYDIPLPEDGYTLINQTEYSYELDPGNYHLIINGLNYNADAVFTVESGKMTDLVVTMTEWKIPTFWLWSTPNTPSGLITSGVHVKLYEFAVAHNWDQPLVPSDFGILITLQGTATMDNCEIDIQTLSGFQKIGGPVTPSFDGYGYYYDYAGPNDLDMTLPICPNSSNAYAIFCDAYGQTGDTFSVGMYSFGAITDNGYLIGQGGWPNIYILAF